MPIGVLFLRTPLAGKNSHHTQQSKEEAKGLHLPTSLFGWMSSHHHEENRCVTFRTKCQFVMRQGLLRLQIPIPGDFRCQEGVKQSPRKHRLDNLDCDAPHRVIPDHDCSRWEFAIVTRDGTEPGFG
mmetsp:Transcript_10852/g.24216  ORF Transcript_10852/g.24216 Transcript_10852/m.24216 type:complete len:127 (+) Transcript_10852:1193-1573(+)